MTVEVTDEQRELLRYYVNEIRNADFTRFAALLLRLWNHLMDLQAAKLGSVVAMQVSGGLEDDLWLVPIEDRREKGAEREGMRSGFTLGQYLMLVEYTGRMLREGKAAISSEVVDIFARLGCTPETWGVRLMMPPDEPSLTSEMPSRSPASTSSWIRPAIAEQLV